MITYRNDLTAEYLRSRVLYNPETGEFTYRWVEDKKPGYAMFNKYFAGKKVTQTQRGYVRIKINGTRYGAHRLAFLYITGKWPEEEVDHINLNPSDNRFCNLRLASRSQNQANRLVRRINKLGVKGVSRHSCGKYVAQIKKGHKVMHLGLFSSIAEAASAYEKASKKIHREYARV